MDRHRCVVKWRIATYSGEEVVYCDPDDDNDYIIAKAKRQVRAKSPAGFPFGSEGWKIIERDYE